MKKGFLFLFCLFIFSAVAGFAQSRGVKKTINRIETWRADKSCQGMELGEVIKTYKNDAVIILSQCCQKHKSACLDTYSNPENKTLLYIAIETKSYDVAKFLFNLSSNYTKNIDAYGKRKEVLRETAYVYFVESEEDNTSKTPLMLACSNGDLQGTKLLLNYGASLLKKNYTPEGNLNKSAYDYAKTAKHKDPGFMDFVQKNYKIQLDLYSNNAKGKDQESIQQDFLINNPQQDMEQFI